MAARRARVLRDQQSGTHPQALRRHLIEVTQRLLATHGLAGLTTRGIAREAQVSDGVLYNHFADKDDLVVAALAQRLAELGARFSAQLPQPGAQPLRAGLTALVRLSLSFLAEALPLVGGLVTRPDLVQDLLGRIHSGDFALQNLWAQICDFVAAEQDLGTAAADVDPHTVAHVIFGSCQLYALSDLMAGHQEPAMPQPPQPDVDRLIDFLLRACGPSPADQS